ncbi:MAG TPA: cell cycle transcriptional regulator TrcR [Methyloceanibacter sp.]|nr:cell cycle transcriptional regulator TrcR [Methyloceanibacter sp.]
MTRTPLMPKATAVWLVDNTSLTFEQIAQFCGLHVLEVKGIADGDVAHGIKGMDPISSGQLSREEIAAAEKDSKHRLHLLEPKVEVPEVKTKRGPRYTPVSRRQDRPNAILWLLRNHPELKDSQLMRLVGTTKPTIIAIRERSHWNSPNLVAQDPVTLGLCSQIDLDADVKKAAARLERERKKAGIPDEPPVAESLLPTEETIAGATPTPEPESPMASALAREARDAMAAPDVVEDAPDAESVFAKLKDLKHDEEAESPEAETSEAESSNEDTPSA